MARRSQSPSPAWHCRARASTAVRLALVNPELGNSYVPCSVLTRGVVVPRLAAVLTAWSVCRVRCVVTAGGAAATHSGVGTCAGCGCCCVGGQLHLRAAVHGDCEGAVVDGGAAAMPWQLVTVGAGRRRCLPVHRAIDVLNRTSKPCVVASRLVGYQLSIQLFRHRS